MNKLIILMLVASFASFAHADSVQVPKEVFNELQKFRDNGRPLSPSFVQSFPEVVHQSILEREKSFVRSLNGQCKETINISFGPRIMDEADPASKAFESGLVRIEASKCYDNASPDELITVSASPAFKKRAFPTLKNITAQDGGLLCETTTAPSVGSSRYCYMTYDLEKGDARAAQVNFLTFNDEGRQFDAPVYYREAYVSAQRMKSQTLYYVISYVRSTPITGIKKYFAKDYIAKVQADVFAELAKSVEKK